MKYTIDKIKYSILIVFLISVVVLSGCTEYEEVDLEADETGDTQTQDLEDELVEVPEKNCPESCDDRNACTEDSCSQATDFECENTMIKDCCGNDLCEVGETTVTCSDDCPACTTTDPCKTAEFNHDTQKCDITVESPCCGNLKCEFGEDSADCSSDCMAISIDLKDYPGIIDSNAIIAIGDDAKGNDVFGASAIGTSLSTKGKTLETLTHSKIANLDAQDLIVIGRPSENGIWKELLGVEDNFLGNNKGIIKLIENNGHAVIFLSGDTPDNTQKLAEVLANPSQYSSLKGTEVEATIGSSIILS